LPEAIRTTILEGQRQGVNRTGFETLVDTYSRGSAEQHSTYLLARFYCRDFNWAAEQLQYEIEAFEEDRSELLIALWREKPEETETLAQKWVEYPSRGLQKTARGFLKATVDLRQET
jgi:hypothetical protein